MNPASSAPMPATTPAPVAGNGHHATSALRAWGPPLAPPPPEDAVAVLSEAGRASMPLADCEVLLAAVSARLKRGAQALVPPPALLQECAEALDLLQRPMRQELRRQRQLELALFDAQVYLAQARAELEGTRDSERRARYQALHDGLTELPNRRCFSERLDAAIAAASSELPAVAVLYIDLDEFKAINDSHGHTVGDAVLRIVAARLRRVVRSSDVVSRIGGDEFACLRALSGDPRPLAQLAEKLAHTIAEPMTIDALRLEVHASIGVAVYPGDGASADSLLRTADAAMYLSKRTGGGPVFHAG